MIESGNPASEQSSSGPSPGGSSSEPPSSHQGGRKAALGFVFAVAAMDMLAIGVIVPVLPKLVLGFEGGNVASASQVIGVFAVAWATMQFIFSPIQGALSDRYGRRPVLLLSIAGLGVDYLFMALAPNLAWLFVGRLISGAAAASFSTASAYIADITPPEQRARRFGMLGAAWAIGFIVGPAIGGALGGFDPRLPFWVAAGLALLNALYGYFFVPESLPKERRAPFELKRANPLGSLQLLRSHRDLGPLAAVMFLYSLAHQVLPTVFVLYTGYRYGWSPFEVGMFLAALGASSVVVQMKLIDPVVKRIGESGALVAGLLAGMCGFLVFGLATTTLTFWLGLPFFAFMALTQPGAQGLMTRRVSAAEQGRLQGANSSLMGLAGMVGPLLFSQIFAWSISAGGAAHLPGAAQYFAAFLLALAFLMALIAGGRAAASRRLERLDAEI